MQIQVPHPKFKRNISYTCKVTSFPFFTVIFTEKGLGKNLITNYLIIGLFFFFKKKGFFSVFVYSSQIFLRNHVRQTNHFKPQSLLLRNHVELIILSLVTKISCAKQRRGVF